VTQRDRSIENHALARDEADEPTHRIRLPRFIVDDDIGLGDAVTRATSYVGVPPCGGCERRAAALNRWLVFTRHPRK
jgi:hypothetical protein